MRAQVRRDLVLVALGGALGSLGRYGLAAALPHGRTGLPLATLLVNAVGCLLLGVLASRPTQHWVRPLVGTGVLGGFTTFSAFALETDRLLQSAPPVAAAYLALTVLLGLAAAQTGVHLGNRRRPPTSDEVPV